jgi:hypothetical protein
MVIDYYKSLFGFKEKLDIDLVEDFWQAEDLVTSEHNKMSDAGFTEHKVSDVAFQIFGILANDCNKRELDLFRLNFSELT